MDKIKGKTVAKYKAKDRDVKGKSFKDVEKVTRAGEKVHIQTTKYKRGVSSDGTKSVTRVTGNTKNMGHLGGSAGRNISGSLSKVTVKKYKK
jgi:uncharacterized protein YajQ (UPF0234 family)